MASQRQKPQRKGPSDSRRTQPAWSGARGSAPFSSPASNPRPSNNTSPTPPAPFPPLAHTNGTQPNTSRDRNLQSLVGLTGITVTLSTKSGQRYEGVILSTTAEGDTTGVTLKDVKEISSPGTPLKDQLFIASANIEQWSSGPADAKLTNGDSFRTDTDISQKKIPGRERELEAWVPLNDLPNTAPNGQGGDDDTFGPGSTSNAGWDQFAANEQMFGVKTTFDENVYTTKLDRSAADFKERERKAQRIANEILGSASNNPHVAEERGLVVDSTGTNEEEKYGAVIRGSGAYVPPGARRPGVSPQAPSNSANNTAKTDVPKVSVNGPDGTTISSQGQSPPSSKAASPAPAANANKPPADPVPAFRDFVTNEVQRLTQKRQALAKSEMDRRVADLLNFSQTFKLNKPIPDDLVPILAKDEDKQRAIREKASKDAAATTARAIGPSTAATASRGIAPGNPKGAEQARKPITPASSTNNVTNSTVTPATSSTALPKSISATKIAPSSTESTGKKPAINMIIQDIPPFKGPKSRQSSTGAAPVPVSGSNGSSKTGSGQSSIANLPATTPVSPITAANNRLNVNASSFRPNPKANAFTPGAASPTNGTPSASASLPSKSKAESSPSAPNPFYGTRPIKKTPPVHIKDDFNPFKHNKVVEASQVAATWPYNGKRYLLMYPLPQHQQQQHASHMLPPGPPLMPPPSYEEDTAAVQAATQRGYVYAYPSYGYPAQYYQPMMPGMAPPGPPGAYMPAPFMQPMPYPPGMPPPNAMYSPAMGQMPPPQGYMPPPPPGAYPPPPNGAGPRPSMPPTPIPAHAHPYYHQSPQRMMSFDQYSGKMFTMPTVQHAVPYQMMMPPPPNVPPHPYEGGPAPPVQMGGHA